MTKKLIILIVLLFIGVPTFAQSTNVAWVKKDGGTEYYNYNSKDYVLEIGADTGLFSEVIFIPVILTNPDSVEEMNLQFHSDQTALWLLGVSNLNTRVEDWEFFRYVKNYPEEGDITVMAVADYPNQTLTYPLSPGKGVVANLVFQIILDPCPLVSLTPLHFKFIDSTSNTLYIPPNHQFIGQNEIEYKNGYIFIQCSNDVSEEEEGSNLSKDYKLYQNYPNPFNPESIFEYAVPIDCYVKLSIYNILGQRVRVLVDEYQNSGLKSVNWDGKDNQGREVAGGVYFYSIKAGDFEQTKKMILLK